MIYRAFIPVAMLSSALAASAAAQSIVPESAPVMAPAKPHYFDRIIANEKKGEAALDVYERIERVETRKGPNDPTPTAIKVMRVIPSGTGMDRIPVGADGKPADFAAYRAELEKLEQTLALLVSGSRSQREGVEKFEKKKKDRNDLIDATRSAFLFTYLAEEQRGGRALSKYKLDPNPAFKPTTRFMAVFTKVHGFVWVDEEAAELARIEGDVTEDISIGLFLASFSQYDFDGRKLFSGFSIHERTSYSNYRYIGPPKEALVTIRQELGHASLDKSHADPANQ